MIYDTLKNNIVPGYIFLQLFISIYFLIAALIGRQVPFLPFRSGNNKSLTLLHTNDLYNHPGPVTHDIYSDMDGFEKTAGILSI